MDTLTRLLRNFQSRVLLMIGRGVLKAVSDEANAQLCQVALLDGELKSKVERVQNYGISSVPPENSVATVLFVGGDRSNGLVIAAEDRKIRVKGLKSGEIVLYTDEGDQIYFKRNRQIALKTSKFVVDAQETEFSGTVKVLKTLEVEQNITGKAEIADKTGNMTQIRTVYDGHTHTGNAGNSTSAPLSLMGG